MWGASDGDDLGASKAVSQAITNMWYNGELGLYSTNFYGNEPSMGNFADWGHFSQVVWVDTKQVGCAVHLCEPGTLNPSLSMWYSVCNYYPAGMLPLPLSHHEPLANTFTRQHGWCLCRERPASRQRQDRHGLRGQRPLLESSPSLHVRSVRLESLMHIWEVLCETVAG